jgi:methyltransferase (TIGR00027 family)
MKEDRPSRTAEWVAFLRGLATLEPDAIAPDPVAVRLVGQPWQRLLEAFERRPGAALGITRVADRLTGGRGRHLALRTRAIDDEVVAAVAAGARQLVLLGAGLDARAYRLDALADVTVYEVDHPATQGWKRAHIEGLAPKAKAVHHVAVDFEKDDWRAKLVDAGFDAGAKAVFIWEGVTMYLTSEAIEQTLASIGRGARGVPGTRLLVTYRTPHRGAPNRAVSVLVRLVGEPFTTEFTPDDVRRLVAPHGLRVLADTGDEEWAARYLGKHLAASVERLAVCER